MYSETISIRFSSAHRPTYRCYRAPELATRQQNLRMNYSPTNFLKSMNIEQEKRVHRVNKADYITIMLLQLATSNCAELRKCQAKIMFRRYYFFLHHCLLFCRYAMPPKSFIRRVNRNGRNKQPLGGTRSFSSSVATALCDIVLCK